MIFKVTRALDSKSTPQLIVFENQICDALQISKSLLTGPEYFAPDAFVALSAHDVAHGPNMGSNKRKCQNGLAGRGQLATLGKTRDNK